MSKNTNEKVVQGTVIEALPSANFRIDLGGEIILGYLSGKMRIYRIKVMPGDKVLVRLSPDGRRGIIIKRI